MILLIVTKIKFAIFANLILRDVSSVGLERLLDRQEVTGSIPVRPTKFLDFYILFLLVAYQLSPFPRGWFILFLILHRTSIRRYMELFPKINFYFLSLFFNRSLSCSLLSRNISSTLSISGDCLTASQSNSSSSGS